MSTLLPAYGKDYRTQKEALEAWESGKDFLICDMSNPWDGKPMNILQAGPKERYRIRYDGKRKSFVVSGFTADKVEHRLRREDLNRDQLSVLREWVRNNPQPHLQLLLERACTQLSAKLSR